jgi:EAL and modified HD-GYP domain-containing signal transduction protein
VIVEAVLTAVLVLVVAAAAWRLRALRRQAAALEAERSRLAADGDALRAQLEERRLELEALAPYRRLVDRADDWIWAVDEHGALTFSSPSSSALLGYDDLNGRSLAELTHPDDQPAGWIGIVRRRHADGSWRTVDSRSVRSGEGWQGIDRDLGAAAPEPGSSAPGVAIVRSPVVDGRREVVAYELIGDAVLHGFAPAELLELGAGRPVWVSPDGAEPPDLDRERIVLQIPPDATIERALALTGAGFPLALDEFEGEPELLEHCAIVKVAVAGRADDDLRALIAAPAERGLLLVATGVADADEFTRCQVLGFSHFQGEFFSRPRGEKGGGAAASLQSLRELTGSEPSFEDLERIVSADVGLSIALLRHVNSAFFALPRKIDTVREALTLLGVRAVRRWATVVALTSITEAPDQLIALALLRGRMCELVGRRAADEERDRLFTVGLFSVADALLDAPMDEVLETLPFSEEIGAALLRWEGPLGDTLASVLRYEQGHLPAEGDATELAEAYLAALRWADRAGWWVD